MNDENREDSGNKISIKKLMVIIRRLSEIAAIFYILEFIGKMITNANEANRLMKDLSAIPSTIFNIAYCFVLWGIAYFIDYMIDKNENK
jgi:hypothetical protein